MMNEIEGKVNKLSSPQSKKNTDGVFSHVGSYRGGGGLDSSEYDQRRRRNSSDRGYHNGSGNTTGDHGHSGANNGMHSDYQYRERMKKKYGDGYRNVIDSSNFGAQGSIDIQLEMQSKEQENSDDITKSSEIEVKPIKNQMSLSCYIPPKSGRNAFASFSGKTGLFYQRGYADTTLSLGYHLFRGNSILCDWHTIDGTSKVRQTYKV